MRERRVDHHAFLHLKKEPSDTGTVITRNYGKGGQNYTTTKS
eukprot:COSAG02_NODE_1674_length_11381_cov_5.445045_4_plen_42_part_00